MAKKSGEPWIYQSDRGLLMFNSIEQLYAPIRSGVSANGLGSPREAR
jgi:hypothetical protein